MKMIETYCENCDGYNTLECAECELRVKNQDLLERIEILDRFMRHSETKYQNVSLNVTHKELRFIKMWINIAKERILKW